MKGFFEVGLVLLLKIFSLKFVLTFCIKNFVEN